MSQCIRKMLYENGDSDSMNRKTMGTIILVIQIGKVIIEYSVKRNPSKNASEIIHL